MQIKGDRVMKAVAVDYKLYLAAYHFIFHSY